MSDISKYNNGSKNPDINAPHRIESEVIFTTLGELIAGYNAVQANLKIAHDLNEKYKTALEFYADKGKYTIKDWDASDAIPDILQDRGGHAREALK